MGWKRGWTCYKDLKTWASFSHLSLTSTGLKYNPFYFQISEFSFMLMLLIIMPGRSLGYFAETLNLCCMYNCTLHWLCAQPSAGRNVSLWSQVCFLTEIEMFSWKKICTKVVSHKQQSIQRRKILKAGTSGVILKLRTIFSKTGSPWDLNILQTHKSRKRGFKKIPLGIICLLKEH